MKTRTTTLILAVLLLGTAQVAAASLAASLDDKLRSYQLRRLLQPAPAEEHWEQLGRVFIYSGLHESDIDKAMDRHFDRIQNMMFVRTVVTKGDGVPRADIDSDEPSVEVEDDGC